MTILPVYADQNTFSDPNLQITLNYPDIEKQGEDFVITSIIKATSDQISNITITISSPELELSQNQFHLDKLASGSTFGNNFNASVKESSPNGIFVVNTQVDYYIKGYFDSQPIKHTITHAFQIDTESKPILVLYVQSPQEVFSGGTFSIKGTIKNQGTDAQNVQLVISSSTIDIEGKKSVSISNLDSGKISDFEFVVQTPKDIEAPTNSLIHINGTYTDNNGKPFSVDNSFNINVRQRGILEIGDANGIWVGNFFIAPVVGVGTIVSSTIAFFIFVWHYRNRKKKKKVKR